MQQAILRFENSEIDSEHLFSTLESNANALEGVLPDQARVIKTVFAALGALEARFTGAELQAAVVAELQPLRQVLASLASL